MRRLVEKSLALLWAIKRPLIGVLIVFALLNLVFVRGFSAPIDVEQVRTNITDTLGDSTDLVATNATILGLVLGTSNEPGTATSGVYQSLFVLLLSLALVWMFRQSSAGNKTTAKESIYKSTYPLVPTVIVLMVIGLQMLPVIIGSSLFSIVIDSGIAATGLEQAIWIFLLLFLALLSLYMISSSVFALYIVTLPDMTPMKALRSARQLVHHRRFAVMRRLLWIPIIMFVILAGLMLPAIFFVGFIAPWLYFVLSLLSVPFVHAYTYSLYRELL